MEHFSGETKALCTKAKCLQVLLLPLGWDVHHRVTPTIKYAGTHLCTWVERGSEKAKYLAQ